MTPSSQPAAARYVDRLVREAIAAGQPVCFDSTAMIAYISLEQPVAALLGRLIDDRRLAKIVSTITLAEVLTRPEARGDASLVAEIRDAFGRVPNFRIVDFDQDHAAATAAVRAQTGLKLPDAAIVATARLAGAGALLGNDRQWRGKPLGVPYHHLDDVLALP